MAEMVLSAVFHSHEAAEEAVRKMGEAGLPIRNVSILGQNLQSKERVHGFITVGDVARQGAGMGAWFGGLFGLLVGAAFLWIPGFGPLIVAGPLAATLVATLEGAALGAAGGALVGALIGYGLSRDRALKLDTSIQAGEYVLLMHGSQEEVDRAREILSAAGGTDIAVEPRAV